MANTSAGLTDISLGNFTEVYYGATTAGVAPTTLPTNKLGAVQTVGEITDEATIVDVQAYGQKYLRKLVGSANASAIEVVCNYNPTDPGQVDLLAAYTTTTTRDIGILMNEDNAADPEGTFQVFTALIASASVSNPFDDTRTITFSVVPTHGIGEYRANTIT